MTSWEVVWAFPSSSTILLNIVCKSFLILALAAIINQLLKNSLASYRYLSWKVAYFLLALLLCSTFMPSFSLVPSIEETDAMEIIEALPLPYQTLEHSHEQEPLLPELLSKRATSISWMLLIQWVWLLGGLFHAILFVRQWRSFRRVIKSDSLDVPVSWEQQFQELKARMNVSKTIVLRVSGAYKIPFTFGWRRPFVFLPRTALNWNEAQLETVFRHELGHIQKEDFLSKLLVQWVRIFYWWNPFLWWTEQQIELECEKTCDESVLLSGIAPIDYAQHLIAVASALKGDHKPVKSLRLAMAQAGDLKTRILSILHFQEPISIRKSRRTAYVVLVGVLALLLLNFSFPFEKGANKSTKQLIEELNGNDPFRSLMAAKSLGERKAKAAYPALVASLEKEDPSMRAVVAWALGQIDENRATKDLVPLLRDRFDCVQEKAVLSLGEIGAASTFYDVIKAQKHPNPEIRKASLWSLYRIGCMPAFHHISLHTEDSDPTVSQLAEELLLNFEHSRLRSWFLQSQNNSAKNWVYEHFKGIQQKGKLQQFVKCLAKNQKEEKELLQIVSQYQGVAVLDQMWKYLK